jgi:Na+/H+ antiporter NhaB
MNGSIFLVKVLNSFSKKDHFSNLGVVLNLSLIVSQFTFMKKLLKELRFSQVKSAIKAVMSTSTFCLTKGFSATWGKPSR